MLRVMPRMAGETEHGDERHIPRIMVHMRAGQLARFEFRAAFHAEIPRERDEHQAVRSPVGEVVFAQLRTDRHQSEPSRYPKPSK